MDGRSEQQQPQEREMMFCHECENEWYRDEDGLTCPDCGSDFTEVIEAQHDPRDEVLQEEDYLPLQDFHNHNPWLDTPTGNTPVHDAPDPDEDDISDVQWRSNGPGNLSFQFSRNYSTTVRPSQNQPNRLPIANPLLETFTNIMNGMVAGAPQSPRGQPAGNQGQDAGHDYTQEQHGDQGQAGGLGQQTYRGGGPGYAWTSQTRVLPRNANNAQPQTQPFADLPTFLNQMFTPPPGVNRGDPNAFGNMGPLGLFAGLLNPANMQHGDAVYSQEALDRIISQLMEQNASGNAPGPASADAIANLPQRSISDSDVDDQGNADCSICMETVRVGDKVTVLPCDHWFHGDCIKAWLGEHDTCPHCRKGIMPRGAPADATSPRNPNQAPEHELHWQGEGTSDNPYNLPTSPPQQRTHERGSSNPASPSRADGVLFGRMRDAFGGGGGAGAGAGPSGNSTGE